MVLHGGGEFMPGDEATIGAILDLATERVGGARPIRIAVVPTAAGRGRPGLAAANGVDAFRRVATDRGLDVRPDAVMVIDPASAADDDLARTLAEADVIYLPGGDPDLIPSLLTDSSAAAAITAAHTGGAVLAGASAGAMAMGSWTWTPHGGLPGLGLLDHLTVMPHADAGTWRRSIERFGVMAPTGLGLLGIGERTAVVIEADRPWRVVGEGEARWLEPGTTDVEATRVVRSGDVLERGANAAGGERHAGRQL
jgi:cyanophycinase-like exopeptidase